MIEISLIGAGNMAEHYLSYLDGFKRKYKIKGIYSRTYEKCLKLKKKYGYLNIYQNLHTLINHKPQLIIVAVSEESLLKILKITLKSNIVHLIEKPLGINHLQFNKLNRLIKLNKTKLFISLNRRYYSSIQKLNEIKNKNKSFDLKIIDHQTPMNVNNKDKSVIKYWMYSNSVHLVDLILFLSDNKIIKKNKKIINLSDDRKIYISTFELKNKSNLTYICFWNINGRMSIEYNSPKTYCYLKPIEEILIKHKNKSKLFQESSKYKAGFIQLFKNIDLFFNNQEHKMVSNFEYEKTVNLIKYIYDV